MVSLAETPRAFSHDGPKVAAAMCASGASPLRYLVGGSSRLQAANALDPGRVFARGAILGPLGPGGGDLPRLNQERGFGQGELERDGNSGWRNLTG